jgi:hypothetical protein
VDASTGAFAFMRLSGVRASSGLFKDAASIAETVSGAEMAPALRTVSLGDHRMALFKRAHVLRREKPHAVDDHARR